MVDEKEQNTDAESFMDLNLDDTQSDNLDSLFDDIGSLEKSDDIDSLSFSSDTFSSTDEINKAVFEDGFSDLSIEDELLKADQISGESTEDGVSPLVEKEIGVGDGAAFVIDEQAEFTSNQELPVLEDVEQIPNQDSGFANVEPVPAVDDTESGEFRSEFDQNTLGNTLVSASLSAMTQLDEGIEKPQKPYDHEENLKINLAWYSGNIADKSYEISHDNMPEFLDPHKNIRTIHISVESAYGWNVFFDDGVFMNLLDLKEYQERHAKIPCPSGKIIYGNKTTTFDQIERIVVYVKPKYFAYEVR